MTDGGFKNLVEAAREVSETIAEDREDVMFLGSLERLSRALSTARPDAVAALVQTIKDMGLEHELGDRPGTQDCGTRSGNPCSCLIGKLKEIIATLEGMEAK